MRSRIHAEFGGNYDDTGRLQAGLAVYERVLPLDGCNSDKHRAHKLKKNRQEGRLPGHRLGVPRKPGRPVGF